MPTGPSSSSYIIPPLTLSDTFYEWYKLTNDEIIDKLNRMKVYTLAGATGIAILQGDDGVGTVYLAQTVPGDHTFTGNITFDGSVTTVNTNFMTIDDYNLVLGAVGTGGSNTGGTSDNNITNAGGGGIIIAGACGNKYLLWKAYETGGRTYSAWRVSDPLAFTGEARFYSNNNSFTFFEGDDSTPASALSIKTYSSGNTVDVQPAFSGVTYGGINFLRDGSSRLIDSSVVRRFTNVANIISVGITFGSIVRHIASGGITLAQANNVTNAESLGVVVGFDTGSARSVDVALIGYVGGTFSAAIATADATTSLGTGEFYFLSDVEPGKITKNAPTLTNTVRKPVLYALDSNKALVMNYVGNKIVDLDSIYSKLNASTVIIKHTDGAFAIGDVVRFEEGTTSASRPYGSYVKASSGSPEESEALGVISKINYGGDTGSSLMTVSGFIDLSGMGYTLAPGSVYYLGTDPGKLTDSPTTTVGSVRKPILVAVSPYTGIVQNYVGLVVNTNTSNSGTSSVTDSSSRGNNKLINGNFDIWQRGTTFGYRNVVSETDRYCADRWKVVNSGSVQSDRLNLQVNRVPLALGDLQGSNVYSKYALEFDIGTGGYTGNSETYLFQRVEGIEHLPRGYATLSFYAKATVSNARLGIAFRRDFGGGTAPDWATTGVEKNSQKVKGTVITVPNYWKKFTYTFTLPDSAGGVVGATGNDGPEIKFYLRAGATFANKDISEAINPNLAGVVNYKIQIAQVQLEEGIAASPFFEPDPQSEMSRCMRYYQTTSASVPYRQLTSATVPGADSINYASVSASGIITTRYLVDVRSPSTSSVDIKTSTGAVFSVSSKGSKGFRATRDASAGAIDIQYQVESEL